MAFIKVVNTNTVDGILSDFQTKVEQLNALADKQDSVIAVNDEAINRLKQDTEQRAAEASRAREAARKIQSFFN